METTIMRKIRMLKPVSLRDDGTTFSVGEVYDVKVQTISSAGIIIVLDQRKYFKPLTKFIFNDEFEYVETIHGQELVVNKNEGDFHYGNKGFICPVCNKFVHMHECYYDPYFKPNQAAQVHRECLSTKRADEIVAIMLKDTPFDKSNP